MKYERDIGIIRKRANRWAVQEFMPYSTREHNTRGARQTKELSVHETMEEAAAEAERLRRAV